MKRKKIKRIIVAALTVAILSSNITSTAMGITKDENELNYSKIVQTIKEESEYEKKEDKNTLVISKDIDTESEEIVSVIVEFVSDPLALERASGISTYGRTETKVDRDHRLFNQYLINMPVGFSSSPIEVKYSYKEIFNGVALNIKGTDIKKLVASGVIKRIHKDTMVQVDLPVEEVKTAETSEVQPFMADSLPHLGVDKLHDDGIKGQGIKVGVLDTGIDYNHPDLKNVYKGFKGGNGDEKNQDINSTLGWDFINNDADPMETTYADWLASGEVEVDSGGNAYYTSHGTHVSGTIAGTGENVESELPVLGVAPEVELYGYKVLGKRGSGSTSAIIAGVEKSVTDGMDVINMSLGSGRINDPFDPMVTAVNNASLAGVVTVISNGNSGPNPQTVTAPGTAQLPIAVGASSVDFNYDTYTLTIGDGAMTTRHIGKSMVKNLKDLVNKELEVVHCNLGYEKDYEGKDVQGKVVLVDRGTITFAEKVATATKKGAAFVIIANNAEESENPIPYLGETQDANTLSITKADGEILKANLDKKLTINFKSVETIKGDEVASFSSVGPVKRSSEIRPDVVAPGVQVYSAAPEFINDKNEDTENYGVAYQRMSGTSMAAPHVAGIAALILQNNPDYTPEDVKAAIMNTSKELYKSDGSNYSVHEAGSGRVEPYEAVYEEVLFKAKYKAITGMPQVEIDNITGMLSYGKFYNTKNGEETKTIPITITNNTSSEKQYNVGVEYSTSERGKNAANNGVNIQVPETISVPAGSEVTIDAKLNIPMGVELGNYEGFIKFKESSGEKDYQMPFSATVSKDGFISIDYPSMQDNYAKGMSAITSSALFNRSMNSYGLGDIALNISISEPTKFIHTVVKDRETGEYIGYAGKLDASWVPDETVVNLEGILTNGKVKKIVGKNVSHEEFPIESGIYDLELYGETYDGKIYKDSTPIAIVNDTKGDTVNFNIKTGITEVTEDMFTKEYWYDGAEHEGIWIKANVFNETVDKLKKEAGLDFLRQEELNTVFAAGFYPNGERIGMSTMSKTDGEVVIAGVEKSDLDEGFFRVQLDYSNAGRIANKPYNHIFVKQGTEYLSLDSEDVTLSEGTSFNAGITLNNGNDITEGTFVIQNFGDPTLKIKSVQASKELKELLAKNNNNIEIDHKTINEEEYENFEISFKLTGNDIKGLNGNIKLLDVVYEVESLKGVGEDVKDDAVFFYNSFRGISSNFKNSKGEDKTVHAGTIYKNFDVESNKRTLIYVSTYMPMGNMNETKVYAVDPNGNRYEPTYSSYDEWMGRFHNFAFNDLPIIEGDYKIVQETPGAFDSIVYVPGSKLNSKGERVGNAFGVVSHSYIAQPMRVYLGDTNKDGAIDIVDAMEIAKEYVPQEVYAASENEVVRDLNQDGNVDITDMEILKYNYLMQDFSNPNSKVPEKVVNGMDLIDVLEYCGYFDEDYYSEMNVALNLDKEASLAGDVVNLEAVPPTEEVEFDYEFSVREKNDKEWTVVQERSKERTASWTSAAAGQYEFKVRIYLDEVEYVWQDNKLHTVEWRPIESIELDKETLELKVKDEAALKVSVLPEYAEPQEFTWTSSNTDVVNVDENGVVKAIGVGEATITVSTKDGKFTDTCRVKVSPEDILLKSIKLSDKKLKMDKGESEQLEVIFKPENATNKNVTWVSSDDKVATVKDGLVTAVGAGEAVITVTSEEGGYTAKCNVTVKDTEKPVDPEKPVNPEEPIKPEDTEKPDKPSKPEEPSNTNKPNLPQTGAVVGSAAILVVGAILVGAGALTLKRRKDGEE